MEALGWLRAIVARVVPVAGAGRAPEAAGEALWLRRRRTGGREAVRGFAATFVPLDLKAGDEAHCGSNLKFTGLAQNLGQL